MKAIIIAAGTGSRLYPLTKDLPKCMLRLNGKTILEMQLEVYRKLGINNIAVIKGYMAEKINLPGIKYYINNDYKENNILNSLFYAEKEMDEEFIVSYSDIIFENKVVEKLLECNDDICAVVDKQWKNKYLGRTLHPASEAEKAIVNNDRITIIGKGIQEEDGCHEFIGMIKVSKRFAQQFRYFFNIAKNSYDGKKFYEARAFKKAYLTDFIHFLIDQKVKITPIIIEDSWMEIDTKEDLERARKNWR